MAAAVAGGEHQLVEADFARSMFAAASMVKHRREPCGVSVRARRLGVDA